MIRFLPSLFKCLRMSLALQINRRSTLLPFDVGHTLPPSLNRHRESTTSVSRQETYLNTPVGLAVSPVLEPPKDGARIPKAHH